VASLAPGAPVSSNNVLQVDADIYAFVVPYNEKLETGAPGAPFATMVAWAESPGAARRALSREVEADPGPSGKPAPNELLPAAHARTYAEVLAAARTAKTRAQQYATYRVGSDGAFVHRVIDCGRTVYCFRSTGPDDTERPYAIIWKF